MRIASMEVEEGGKKSAIPILDFVAMKTVVAHIK